MSNGMANAPKRKRVLVVGAGAAGMACTEQLSMHPDRFDVTLVEAQDYCGGQAFSIPIDEERYGAPWMNQGVQGLVAAISALQSVLILLCVQWKLHLPPYNVGLAFPIEP